MTVVDDAKLVRAGFFAPKPFFGQQLSSVRWPHYCCDHSVTSADVRLSAGPNFSPAARQRPVNLASPGRADHCPDQNATPRLLPRQGRSLPSAPAQIRTSASTHTALTRDQWRKSERRGRGAERGVEKSIGVPRVSAEGNRKLGPSPVFVPASLALTDKSDSQTNQREQLPPSLGPVTCRSIRQQSFLARLPFFANWSWGCIPSYSWQLHRSSCRGLFRTPLRLRR